MSNFEQLLTTEKVRFSSNEILSDLDPQKNSFGLRKVLCVQSQKCKLNAKTLVLFSVFHVGNFDMFSYASSDREFFGLTWHSSFR